MFVGVGASRVRDLFDQGIKNAPCIVFAEVSGSIQGDPSRKLSTRPQMERDEWQKFCEKISELGKYLEDEGMPLAYHHHMGTVIETQKDTERLMENTHESVKLTLDTGHMLFAKGDSKSILQNPIHIILISIPLIIQTLFIFYLTAFSIEFFRTSLIFE